MQVRRACWAATGALAKSYPTLAKVAPVVLLSIHATSCAPERNWSLLGNMYSKPRTALGIEKAEKRIASAAKARRGELKSNELIELELLCSDVDQEEVFGDTLLEFEGLFEQSE